MLCSWTLQPRSACAGRRAIRRGRNLFQRKFKVSEGAGPRTLDGTGDINTIGSIGAGLADSVAKVGGMVAVLLREGPHGPPAWVAELVDR